MCVCVCVCVHVCVACVCVHVCVSTLYNNQSNNYCISISLQVSFHVNCIIYGVCDICCDINNNIIC